MQNYLISTIAGGGLPVTAASAAGTGILNPASLAVDSKGSVYFLCLNAVFKVNPAGALTRIAGYSGQTGYLGDGGIATSAWLSEPQAIVLDSAGNVYIADSGNNRIRKVGVNGVITTIAGTGVSGYSGDGAAAVNAELANPTGVAFDSNGNLYIADNSNNAIRRITADGLIATVAQIPAPNGLAIDGSGIVYTESGGVIYSIMLGGSPVAFAGGGNGCSQETDIVGDGCPATAAILQGPQEFVMNSAGNLYIADSYNNRIREVSGGIMTTVAGGGTVCAKATDSVGDGCSPTSSELGIVLGVAIDSQGNLFIADGNNRIRKVSGSVISTIAGASTAATHVGDGETATNAQLQFPYGIALDASGNLFISDTYDARIREVNQNGFISTVAGGGSGCAQQKDAWGNGCPATGAILSMPYGVAVDTSGNLYIADNAPSVSVVRKVGTNGVISVFAGGGTGCKNQTDSVGDGCPASSASLDGVTGLAVDTAGNLYLCDSGNFLIRKVSLNGTISAIGGNGTPGYSGDGGVATQAAIGPATSIAVDGSGNVYFADPLNFRIREITTQGTIITVAGNGTSEYLGDGMAATANGLSYPEGVAVGGGNIYLSDGISSVREVTPNGVMQTIAGGSSAGYAGDGGPALQGLLFGPNGLAVDSAGDVLVADGTNSVVRGLWPQGAHPLLNVTSSHSGNFSLGQSGGYTIEVSNAPLAGATAGPVTVTEAVPSGMSLAWMSGTGWTCSPNPCTRSDSLSPGQKYPPITAMMVVGSTPPVQAVNQVGVSGGGYLAASAADVTNIATPATAPQAQAATPGGGGGSGATFTFTFSDPNGWQTFTVLDVLINSGLTAVHSCYFAFVPSSGNSGSLFLVDDKGDAGGPYAAMQLPGIGSVQNSQCAIRATGSSVAASGSSLVLTLAITFGTGLSGNQVIYTAAQDLLGYNTGWQELATWNVPGVTVVGPGVAGMTPSRANALNTTYTFTLTDPNGWADLSVLDVLVNNGINAVSACYLAVVPSAQTLYLVDDKGDAGGPYAALQIPSTGSVSNSQCTISGQGSSLSGSGNTLTLVLNMTFSQTFGGNRVFYVAARNGTTGNSGWQPVGSAFIP